MNFESTSLNAWLCQAPPHSKLEGTFKDVLSKFMEIVEIRDCYLVVLVVFIACFREAVSKTTAMNTTNTTK